MLQREIPTIKRTMELKQADVNSLKAYPENARTHNDKQVAQIAESIKEFGFCAPCLVDEKGVLIAGHGRVMAAQSLGLKTVPTISIEHLTPEQVKAYRLADNQLALNAGWDFELLGLELGELNEGGFNLDLLGFDPKELETLLERSEGLTDPDEVPEEPETSVTKEGDLWLLGNHRLLCGDSTDENAVRSVLGNVKPHLMVTDPPYGVEYDANWRNEADRASGKKIGARAVAPVHNDERADWSEAWALFPGDVAYVWHGGIAAGTVSESLQANNFSIRAQIIWSKNNMAIGRGDYHWQHEPCWYAVRKNKKGHYCGGRKQTTVWEIDKPMKSETGHSTQKPVECMKRPIENNSSQGQAVYEPFSGSGTTIIAAEMTGRCCHAIELSPSYVDIAVARWENFTGKDATLETGETFKERSIAQAN
jgi:DNA modification methylase